MQRHCRGVVVQAWETVVEEENAVQAEAHSERAAAGAAAASQASEAEAEGAGESL